jgi:hypothetical protein
MANKQPMSRLLVIAAVLWCATAAPGLMAADEPGLSQDLGKLRVPDKVDAVLWTRRNDTYTLQVVFPRYSALGYFMKNQPGMLAPVPRVQVWLLRSNGTVIGWKRQSMPGGQSTPVEINYSYSIEAAREAVAIAIMVDDVYRIEPLVAAPPASL